MRVLSKKGAVLTVLGPLPSSRLHLFSLLKGPLMRAVGVPCLPCTTAQARPSQTNLNSSPACVKNVLSGTRPGKVYMQMHVQKGFRTKSHSPTKARPKRRSSGTELPKFQITVQRDCDGARCSARSPTKVCGKNNLSMSNDHHIRQLAVFASTTQLCRAPLQSLRQGEDAPVAQNRRVIVRKAETGLILAPGSAGVP